MRMTATEAAHHFSAVLGRVAAGEEIEVVRNGAPVAVIAPPPGPLLAQRSGGLFESVDATDSFADDLQALKAQLEAPPDF